MMTCFLNYNVSVSNGNRLNNNAVGFELTILLHNIEQIPISNWSTNCGRICSCLCLEADTILWFSWPPQVSCLGFFIEVSFLLVFVDLSAIAGHF